MTTAAPPRTGIAWVVPLGLLASIAAGRSSDEPTMNSPEQQVRGPGGYAGPGSLGGTPSELGGSPLRR